MDQKKSYTFLEIKQKLAAYCSYQDRCHQEVEQKVRDFLLIPEVRSNKISDFTRVKTTSEIFA
ncbi:hypothetical protein FIC_00322 [Flavobacteriaceae bacterium 3519-10]|nr:hypothetical protein FIC_00322 [Flavobacteriaceae bacterium 3519-10]